MKDRVKLIYKWAFYYALGGPWTPPFKRTIIWMSCLALVAIGTIAFAVTGDISFYPTLPIYFLLLAFWLSLWLAVQPLPPNYKPCEGPRNVYGSPSGEMQLGICHGCESWALTIRGCEVGLGRGKDELVKRLNELEGQWGKDVPYIATELRECREGIEEEDDLTTDLMPDVPNGGGGGLDVMGDAISAAMQQLTDMPEGERKDVGPAQVMQALAAAVGDNGMAAVMVPADQFAEFAAWKESQGESVDGNAPVVAVSRRPAEADPREDADLKAQAAKIADDMNGEGNGTR